MTQEALKLALEAAYLAGFNASGEGYNGEYRFANNQSHPDQDAVWVKDRDNYVSKALTEQPPQRTWVRLTDEDKHEIELLAGITEDDDGYIVSQVFELTEAKLKQKNGYAEEKNT